MQIRNLKLCDASECGLYSAVNHPWWMRVDDMYFHRQGLAVAGLGYATFGGSGLIMTTARTELNYPCVSQAKSGDESESEWFTGDTPK